MINNKWSDSWYIEFYKTPEGIYHRVFRKWKGYNLFEYDVTLPYEISLVNDNIVEF